MWTRAACCALCTCAGGRCGPLFGGLHSWLPWGLLAAPPCTLCEWPMMLLLNEVIDNANCANLGQTHTNLHEFDPNSSNIVRSWPKFTQFPL